MDGRCQRNQHGVINSLREFSVFRTKIFFFDISKSRDRTGEGEVTTIPTRCPQQYATIFVFRSKKCFFDISISECGTVEREVLTVPMLYPELYVTIFVFRFFLQYLDFYWSHR